MMKFLLPRCERCDKRLGPNHDPAACVKRSVSRRHFLMAGAGAMIASAVAAIVRPLPLYGAEPLQATPRDKVTAALNSVSLIAAMRAEWPHWKKSHDFGPVNDYQAERLELTPRPSIEGATIHCPQIEGPDVFAWEVRHTPEYFRMAIPTWRGGPFTKANVG